MMVSNKVGEYVRQMRPYFIVNPIAGAGAAAEKFTELRRLLDERGAEYAFKLTEKAGDAVPFAREAYDAGERYVVAVGGDGTVNEVAGVLGEKDDVIMGICPFGTGNDFAGTLGLSPDPAVIIDTILSGTPTPTDMGYAGDRPFINIMGAGFDVDVVINTERYKSRFHGMIPYLFGVMRSLIHLSRMDLKLVADGKVYEQPTLLVAVANGRTFGGGMPVAPEADPSDGYFDICLIKRISRARFLTLLPLFLKGKHLGRKPIVYLRAKEVELITGRAPIELDGELGEYAPVKITMKESALTIMR